MAPNSPLLQLGEFQFSLQNGVHQVMGRELTWRWPEQGRILRKPALQFTGAGLDRINLEGVIYPSHSGGQGTIDQLKGMGDTGEPYMLTDGLGRVYGLFAINRVQEGRTLFMDTGAARRIEFTIELVEYGEDNPGARGNPFSASQFSGFAAAAQEAVASVASNLDFGTAFDVASWASDGQFLLDSDAARLAGFDTGALGAVASQVTSANRPQIGGALGAFGLQALNGTQSTAWTSVGLNPVGLAQQMAAGRGPNVVSVAVEQLRSAGTTALQGLITDLAGGAGATGAMGEIVNAAGSLAPILNVDPFVTEQVRGVLELE